MSCNNSWMLQGWYLTVTFPSINFWWSSMSYISPSRFLALLFKESIIGTCLGAGWFLWSSWVRPKIELSGVRNSWLIFWRNSSRSLIAFCSLSNEILRSSTCWSILDFILINALASTPISSFLFSLRTSFLFIGLPSS